VFAHSSIARFPILRTRPTIIVSIMPPEKPPAFDSVAFLSKVGKGRTTVRQCAGASIFFQGDPADSVFYVQRGRVELRVSSQRGKEAVLAHMGAGEFFGEGCLTGQLLRLASAIAVTEGTVIRITKSAMTQTLQDQPRFSSFFVAHLLQRNARVEADLVDQLFNSSEKRLARTLLLLAHFGKEVGSETVIPKISQETLAEMIGTTRSRVSFFMNKFRKLGFIKYDGRIEVHNSLLSVVLRD